jgi:hypothetical protein
MLTAAEKGQLVFLVPVRFRPYEADLKTPDLLHRIK